jgi:predicted Rossmann fold flavoprotein
MRNDMLQIVMIGGGAAGFFGAIAAAQAAHDAGIQVQVTILEGSSHVLKKVRISGGGRCNVTHHCFDPRAFCKSYPRGAKELISPFQKFQAADTVKWFLARHVRLVAEDDGRMFPDTNSSQTIIDCLMDECERLKIQLQLNRPVYAIQLVDKKYVVHIKDHPVLHADRMLIATGSSTIGYSLATSLGHTITELAPSLFSFKIDHALLQDLPGLSFANAKLQLKVGTSMFTQEGPILITHWGLSGPAILKLSAWAAREMLHAHYEATLIVNWLGASRLDDVQNQLLTLKAHNAKAMLKNVWPQELAKRFWLKLLETAGLRDAMFWTDISKKQIATLAQHLFAGHFDILGKNRFKEEFVECGGVSLKEIDFKTMQSRISSGLYFAGELLDIDGITGGFNFQSAWTTAWIAGNHMVLR